MPLALPNLYCSPNDVYDLGGVEGVQLRLDDTGASTGQTITCTADAAANASVVNVTALQKPLLNGSVLEFLGSGMPATVEVTLAAVAQVGATQLSVVPLSAQVNQLASAVDNGVNLATALRLVLACKYATAQIKLYCCGRYDDSQLVLANSVNFWARYLALWWCSSRRGQSPPKSVEKECERVYMQMERVQAGQLLIEDIGLRNPGWGFVTNTTVEPAYNVARTRVEPEISEGTPTVYAQFIDWSSIYALDAW